MTDLVTAVDTAAAPPESFDAAAYFGITLQDTGSPVGLALDELVELALRRNPRRAHLLVSRILGKHLPVDPRIAIGTGRLLGELVARRLDGDESAVAGSLRKAARDTVRGTDPSALLRTLPTPESGRHAVTVLGYAETATALGHLVAEQLGARWYLHSTRRQVPGVPIWATFEEGHSHATRHLLLPRSDEVLTADDTLVLVDDEISTGRTALATIRALHRRHPRGSYLLATLVDLRDADARADWARLGTELGCRLDVVSLCTARVGLPAGLTADVAEWIAVHRPAGMTAAAVPSDARPGGRPQFIEIGWPADIPDGGRHGIDSSGQQALSGALEHAAGELVAALARNDIPTGSRILVVGTEEFLYLPMRLAAALAGFPGPAAASAGTRFRAVEFQSTTRSPIFVADTAGYPIRHGFSFAASDVADEIPRYLYTGRLSNGTLPDVVLLLADAACGAGMLLSSDGPAAALAASGPRLLVGRIGGPVSGAEAGAGQRRLPEPLTGPAFGSYLPDEVSWLLTDLSELDLEAEVADRERRIQAGQAHYAESLPHEYQPDTAYQQLFAQVLAESAARVATAVGLVTEIVLAERGPDIVLASLARAGTPIGILMRRWAQHRYGLDLPHYGVSIVRGRGIDDVALDYLARHHDPAAVVFVDGWTGKGAIAGELAVALEQYHRAGGPRFDPDLAVLADPGRCTRTFGTRDDFLIPSACLNSTVSGLVSRTVLNREILRPGQFHGAKFYRELAGADVSHRFLADVQAQFDAVTPIVQAGLHDLLAADRSPTFAGWRAVEEIRRDYGIASINFVKPGVGETTRVLLRRVPWRILVREADHPDHRHLRVLAAERGVPVEIRPGLPYSCVGLVRDVGGRAQGEG